MCEIQVSGCQLQAHVLLSAQRKVSKCRPLLTQGLPYT